MRMAFTYQKLNEQRTSVNNEFIHIVQSTFHVPDCVYYIHTEHSSFWQPFYFKSFQMLKFATTHRETTNKTKHQLISKNVC